MNIEEQPKLALLRKSEENWPEFAKVSISVSLLRLLFTEFVSINIACEQAPKWTCRKKSVACSL